MEEFRGVTIMDSLYKVYTDILAERIEKELKEKEILRNGQLGFRKDRGTIDSIYALNYITNKYVKKGKKWLPFSYI